MKFLVELIKGMFVGIANVIPGVSGGTMAVSFGIYDKIIDFVGGGASVVILSFGNTLYNTAINKGILNMLSGVSVGITSSILFAFLITLIFKVKE